MIQVDGRTRSSIFGLIGLVLAAGWVAYGMLGNGNQVFLAVMVILTMVLGAGAALLLRSRS